MNNIREIGIPVNIYKNVMVEEIGVKEEITRFDHRIIDRRIEILTRIYNSSGEVIKEDYINVVDADYDVLKVDSISIDEQKLWQVIDSIRERK